MTSWPKLYFTASFFKNLILLIEKKKLTYFRTSAPKIIVGYFIRWNL